MSSAPRLFDLSCDETICSADSFCVNDYDRGGSRCHCNLGKGGEMCTEGTFLCAELLVRQYIGLCFLNGFPMGVPPGMVNQMSEASVHVQQEWHVQQQGLAVAQVFRPHGGWFLVLFVLGKEQLCSKTTEVHLLNYQVGINGCLRTAETSMFLFRDQFFWFFLFP